MKVRTEADWALDPELTEPDVAAAAGLDFERRDPGEVLSPDFEAAARSTLQDIGRRVADHELESGFQAVIQQLSMGVIVRRSWSASAEGKDFLWGPMVKHLRGAAASADWALKRISEIERARPARGSS